MRGSFLELHSRVGWTRHLDLLPEHLHVQPICLFLSHRFCSVTESSVSPAFKSTWTASSAQYLEDKSCEYLLAVLYLLHLNGQLKEQLSY